MCRSRWIVLLVMAVLCVLLLGSCSKKDQESVPSVKQQLDKAQAAADAASQAAAGSGKRRLRSMRGKSRSLAPGAPPSVSRSTARKAAADARAGGVLSAETHNGRHR